jgi:glycosyltransferase involved in cell wall biosynthesis
MGINSEKIKVIYNGVADNFKIITDEELLVRVRKKYRLPEQYLLFVGLFSPRKNIAGLLKAFAILKKKYAIPHKLLMVGEKGWKYKSDLALVDSLGIAEEVIFTGYVKNEELPAIYTMASAFVFPSLYEGFGLPLLESMACGTPVVTSNISAMPEVVGDAGILVEPNEPLGIAEAVYRLISDKQLAKELTSLGFQRVHCFTWEKAAREMITLFQEIKK